MQAGKFATEWATLDLVAEANEAAGVEEPIRVVGGFCFAAPLGTHAGQLDDDASGQDRTMGC